MFALKTVHAVENCRWRKIHGLKEDTAQTLDWLENHGIRSWEKPTGDQDKYQTHTSETTPSKETKFD